MSRQTRHARTPRAAVLAAILALHAPARANPQDIEEGEPVTLEDAFTDPVGQLALQYSGTFTSVHQSGSKTGTEQGPTFKLGLARGVQISLNPSYVTGNVEDRNQGNVLGDVLVQLGGQTAILPAVAVDIFYAAPFGAGRKSAAYVVRGIASKSLGSSDSAPRLHLNLTQTHLARPDGETRRNRLELAFGGSFLLSTNAALVADIVHGDAERVGRTETFLEAGYSRDLPDDWTCQLGVGRQLGGRGGATRVFFAIEKELSVF